MLCKRYIPEYMVKEKEMPAPFLTAFAYIQSGQLTERLFDVSLKTPIINLKDVFITGIVAHKMGIIPECL